MLIYGKRLLPYRDNFAQSQLKGRDSAKVRWEHRAHVMDHLYALWRQEYRLSLQQRAKWFTSQPCIKVGDVVVLHEEKVKRGYWSLARVCKIFPSRDGSVRKVEISVPRFWWQWEAHETSNSWAERKTVMPPGIDRWACGGSNGQRGGQSRWKYESWKSLSQLAYHAISHETIKGHVNVKMLSLIPNWGKQTNKQKKTSFIEAWKNAKISKGSAKPSPTC